MRVFYGLIITAVILMIGACALKAYKKEGALARVVFLYELGAFICGIIFLVYTYVPGTTITVLCKGLIMASFDWLLVLLMYYTQYYTGMFKGIVGVKVFMIIKASSESGYICGRIQNDRFAVCMPKDGFKNEIMQNSIVSMQDRFNNASFKIRVVVGVYDIEDVDEPVSNMCDKAFIASETIKNNYETNIAYYDDKLLKRTLEERRVIGEFEGALERKEFKMFLQPQVNTHGKTYGAEALVRWQHPDRGLLSPFFFIDILETTGLIYKLDMYMWECAAAKLSEWKKKGDMVHYISVNISTKDFYLIDVYEVITSIVKKYDIEPKMLKLEITETALMSDLKKNMEVIKNLRDYGFKIEIDDFGSGYSSLNMLKDISADVLKIDMAFLRATENEVKGQDILETIISLGGKLGMEVITEGVETDKQLLMLTEMGCHIFQGYYFSKPIPVEEFEQKYMNE